MACSLARRAARFAIFVLRRLGQRSGNRSPNSKTPPQAEASAIGGQAEGEADRAHGGRPTGVPDSVGANRPRTDEHLLQLPREAYPDCGGAATIFMARHPNFILGAVLLSVIRGRWPKAGGGEPQCRSDAISDHCAFEDRLCGFPLPYPPPYDGGGNEVASDGAPFVSQTPGHIGRPHGAVV